MLASEGVNDSGNKVSILKLLIKTLSFKYQHAWSVVSGFHIKIPHKKTLNSSTNMPGLWSVVVHCLTSHAPSASASWSMTPGNEKPQTKVLRVVKRLTVYVYCER